MRKPIAVVVGIGVIATVCMALLVPTGAGAAQTPTVQTPTVQTPTVQTPTVQTPTVQAPSPDTAAVPTKIEAMCQKIPALQVGVTDGLARDTTALTSANDTVAAGRAAMTLGMTGLADAIITHLAALDAGAPPGPTGLALQVKQAQYVAAVVEWSKARTIAFETERQLVFGELQQTLLDSLAGSACP